jgi:uncharacterized membrane protein YecN with MAPEG domain
VPNELILPVTLTIAGAAALLNLWLGLRVSLLRRQFKVSVGDGGQPAIATRMRAHANYTEYTPFFLILLAVVELAAGPRIGLWLVAIVYILGRIAHAFGMDRPGGNPLRVAGILVTWVCLLGLAGYAIVLSYQDRARPAGVSYAELEARASTESATKWLVRRS